MTRAVRLALCLAVLPVSATAQVQIADHLKCYKVKDPLKLAGTVNLDSPQFGLDPGCKISRAIQFCVPASKTVVEAIDKSTKQPITPVPVSGTDPGDRICYKIRCPADPPPDTGVRDQFGTRTLGKLKAFTLCTPAEKTNPCGGDGIRCGGDCLTGEICRPVPTGCGCVAFTPCGTPPGCQGSCPPDGACIPFNGSCMCSFP